MVRLPMRNLLLLGVLALGAAACSGPATTFSEPPSASSLPSASAVPVASPPTGICVAFLFNGPVYFASRATEPSAEGRADQQLALQQFQDLAATLSGDEAAAVQAIIDGMSQPGGFEAWRDAYLAFFDRYSGPCGVKEPGQP